jgi:hypothetical protein
MDILEKIFGYSQSHRDTITKFAEVKCKLNIEYRNEQELKHQIFQNAAQTIGIFSPEKMVEFAEKWKGALNKKLSTDLIW